MGAAAATLIQWFGHACFLIATVSGIHILIDPAGPKTGYPITPNSVPADVILISHDAQDANYIAIAQDSQSSPQVVKPRATPGYSDVTYNYSLSDGTKKAIHFRRIFSYHDNNDGSSLGSNTISTIEVDGLKICHLGALGQSELTPKQIELIGHVDILMVPVGGYGTIGPKDAARIVAQLHPSVIIPMAYRTQYVNGDMQEKMRPVSDFVTAMGAQAVTMNGNTNMLSLTPDTLPEKPTIILFSL